MDVRREWQSCGLVVNQKGWPGLTLWDGNGKIRVGLGIFENRSALNLWDENGNSIGTVP